MLTHLFGNLEGVFVDSGIDLALCCEILNNISHFLLGESATGGSAGNDLSNVDAFVG